MSAGLLGFVLLDLSENRLGIPFVHRFGVWNVQSLDAAFFFAVLGLGLNEAAYMAEIVRAVSTR